MNYQQQREKDQTMEKVYPRDLFNDANLLKCVGRISLLDLDYHLSEQSNFSLYIPSPYSIVSDEDGNTSIDDMTLTMEDRVFAFYRPLNSRDNWPLYMRELCNEDFEEIEVFDVYGLFTKEFKQIAIRIG